MLGQEDPLEKEMATHSSILPGKSHGWRSLVGYGPWGLKELDMTETAYLRNGIPNARSQRFSPMHSPDSFTF